MSSEALAWAMKQFVRPSGAKFTLVALCECANYKTGRITPSIAHLVEITGQNRKTIIAHIAQLEAQGYIADTGERCGQTKQIKVYSAAIGTVPNTEQFQNRNSSKNDLKQSQKRDTEPSWEPSTPVSSNDDTSPPQPKLKPEHVVEHWNTIAGPLGLKQVKRLTPERRQLLNARIRENTVDDFTEAIAAIERSPFLRGDTDRWPSGATFDFFIKKANFLKILEGNYD